MKRIKAGVVGVGYLGRFHAQKYKLIDGADLVGVVDIDAGRAAEVAAETGTAAYRDYKDLFGRVDAVSIATPTESHCSIGVEFLKRGVDVLIEKPMALNTGEADILIREADGSGALIQVGHLERFNPAVLALEGMVHDPMFIESQRLSPFPERRTDIDVILDVMIHDIDIILNLVDSDLQEIKAVGIPVLTNTVDMSNARLSFRNGCVANVTASRVSKDRVRKIRIFQHDAFISIDYAQQHISITRVAADGKGGKRLMEEELDIEKRDSLLEEIKAFVRCSAERTPPLVSGHVGKTALDAARKIQDSVRVSMAEFMGKSKAAP